MGRKKGRPESHPVLQERLNKPARELTIADFCHLFHVTRITFLFRRPPDIDTGIRLPAAVRGAMGRQLKNLADGRKAQDDFSPRAFHGLFADHDWAGRERQFAKPFVIWTQADSNTIQVEISLFGRAGTWRDEIIEAMGRVMIPRKRGGEGGISIDGKSRARRIWPIRDIYWRVREGYPIPPARKAFILSSLTPIIMSGGGKMKGGYDDLFASLLVRLAGLARWHDVAVPELEDEHRIARWCKRVRPEQLFRPHARQFERRSINFGKMVKAEKGIMGHWFVRDYPEQMWPCLVLGTLTNFGFDVSQGAGRYVISEP